MLSCCRLSHCTRQTCHVLRSTSRASEYRFASSSSATINSRYNVSTPTAPPPSKGKRKSIERQGLHRTQGSRNEWSRSESERIDALRQIHSSIQSDNSSDAWNAWTDLCSHSKQTLLGKEDYEKLVLLLVKDGGGEVKLRRLAFQLAQDRRWIDLANCLKAQTKAGHYDSVFEVTSSVLTSIREEGHASSADYQRGPPRVILSYILIMSAISCAHQSSPSVMPLIQLVRPMVPYKINQAGSKEKPTKGFAGNGSPLSISGTVNYIKDIFPNAALAQQTVDYCRHAILAWGLDYKSPTRQENGNVLARRIGLLFSANDPDTAKMLLMTAEEARSEKYGTWLSMTAHHDVSADWNDMTWFTLLSSSIADKRGDLAGTAWSMYNKLNGESEPPSHRIWNALLDGYSRSSNWDGLTKTWNQMQNQKMKPDVYSYTTMINIYFRAHLPNEAMLMLEELKRKATRGEIELTSESMNAVLNGLLSNERAQEAIQLFNQMCNEKSQLPKPNISTMNSFLRSYGRKGDLAKVTSTLRSISDLKMEPDVITYTTVLDAFSRVGIQDGVDQVYEMMQSLNVRESGVTLTTLIRTILEVDNTTPDFDLALSVLDKMESKGPYPTAVTYTCIISALFHHSIDFTRLQREGRLPESYQRFFNQRDNKSLSQDDAVLLQHRPEARMALILVNQMRKRGLKLDRISYHTIIAGLLRFRLEVNTSNHTLGITEAYQICLQRAMTIFQELCNEMEPSEATWKLILERLTELCTSSRDAELTDQACKHLSDVLAKVQGLPPPLKEQTLINVIQRASAAINVANR